VEFQLAALLLMGLCVAVASTGLQIVIIMLEENVMYIPVKVCITEGYYELACILKTESE
jgi:hypothetical protein